MLPMIRARDPQRFPVLPSKEGNTCSGHAQKHGWQQRRPRTQAAQTTAPHDSQGYPTQASSFYSLFCAASRTGAGSTAALHTRVQWKTVTGVTHRISQLGVKSPVHFNVVDFRFVCLIHAASSRLNFFTHISNAFLIPGFFINIHISRMSAPDSRQAITQVTE